MKHKLGLSTCAFAGLAMNLAVAQTFPPGPGDASCPDRVTAMGAFKILMLSGDCIPDPADPNQCLVIEVLGDSLIGRSDPFTDGTEPPGGAQICTDPMETPTYPGALIVADPCRPPVGWPEGPPLRREVHTEVQSLELTGGMGAIRAGEAFWQRVTGTAQEAFFRQSTGEVASENPSGNESRDFPAKSYFNLFVEVDLGPQTKFYNKTPIVVERADALRAFPPTLDLPTEVYIHDPTFGAVPLFDMKGFAFGYLASAGHGLPDLPSLDAPLRLPCPATFTVDADTIGLDPAITMKRNDVFDDNAAAAPARMVTVYVSSSDSQAAVLPDISNARVLELIGQVGDPSPPNFAAGDKISSLSFGQDGTDGAPGTLLFSVGRDSAGMDCTDVWHNAPGEAADDIYGSAVPIFGGYGGPVVARAPSGDNTLAADGSHLGLRPLIGVPGEDDVTSLEADRFEAGDFFYGTFAGPSFSGSGDQATIFVYDPMLGPFNRSNLRPFSSSPQPWLDLGLQQGDVIDALALSDVTPPNTAVPNGVMDANADEVLVSLAPSSPTLWGVDGAPGMAGVDDDGDGTIDEPDGIGETGLGDDPWSPATVFFSDFDGTFTVFAQPAATGLLATDDIDALDIKPVPALLCGNNVTEPPDEECDGTDNVACNGLACLQDCTCTPPVCGDNVVNQPSEKCDGTDSAACNGRPCLPDCMCTPFCGDFNVDAGEDCDPPGSVGQCGGFGGGVCQADCSCRPVKRPALPAWGLVGLGLVLLAGLLVVFGRRRTVSGI